jgi:hypothetical protein
MQVPGAAASRADGYLAGELGLRPGRECPGFFMADVHPLDLAAAADGVCYRVEAVADDAVNSLDSCLRKGLHQFFCYSS